MNIDITKFKHKHTCRICNSKDVHKFISLGPTPLANSFLNTKETSQELYFPLDVYFCNNCYLVQLLDIVNPEEMFKDYAYITGASSPMTAHFANLASDVHTNFNKSGLVIDIGSNDGTLLLEFAKYGYKTLGVEPSNISKIAEDRGIETINTFFDESCANQIVTKFGKADVITATNVFAHIDNIESVLKGVDTLLSTTGVFIIEAPYLPKLIKNVEFDTIYHEHLSYFSLQPLIYFFNKYGFEVVDVKSISSHGGSNRIFVQRLPAIRSENVKTMLMQEIEDKIYSFNTYLQFANNVELIKNNLTTLLKIFKSQNLKIVGYGATAKGNTLLNYCKIGPETLDYISDTTPTKQGTYSPGMHIPIVSEKTFHEDIPDIALLLAWNYADTILIKENEYIKNDGKFIIPIPEPKVITNIRRYKQ